MVGGWCCRAALVGSAGGGHLCPPRLPHPARPGHRAEGGLQADQPLPGDGPEPHSGPPAGRQQVRSDDGISKLAIWTGIFNDVHCQ